MNSLSLLTSGELGGAALRRRLVGAALRGHRERIGYGLEEAANVLECDRSKISRIETGQRGIRARDLRDLLTEYGIGDSEQAALAAIANPRSAWRDWWMRYADIVPAGVQELLSVETVASEIFIYDAQQVPDLVQTWEYARAAAECCPQTPEPRTLDRFAEMTRARQQIIMTERRTAVSVVIGEGALRQVVGNAEVMRGQFCWLAEVSDACPQATLQVLPFGAATSSARSAPMTVLRFAQAPGLGVVHLRSLHAGVCLIDQTAVADYVQVFTQLQASALPPHQSAQLIREMMA